MKRTRCSAVIKCFMKPMTQIICINYNDLLVNSKPLLSTRLSNLLIETDWFQLNWLNASEMVTVTTISTTIWLRYFGTFSPHCLLFLLLFAIVVDLFRSISLSFSCKHLTTKFPFKLNRLWITFRLIANKKGNKWSAPKNQKKNRFNSFPHFFRCFFFVLFCLFVFICYFKWWAVRENKQKKKKRWAVLSFCHSKDGISVEIGKWLTYKQRMRIITIFHWLLAPNEVLYSSLHVRRQKIMYANFKSHTTFNQPPFLSYGENTD